MSKIKSYTYGANNLSGRTIINLAKDALSEGSVIEVILDFSDSYTLAEVRQFIEELADYKESVILNRTFRCDRLIQEFNLDSWIMATMGYEPIVSP